ncbi:MAG TPA: hypothetical protein VMA83_10580 [Solirubrobacteraceae bacterium]|nr:hypothetical protein [Solirubrobacteraceae bacterium]
MKSRLSRAALCAATTVLLAAPQSAAAATTLKLHSVLGQVEPGDQVEADAQSWTLETSAGSVSCVANSSYDGTYGTDLSNGEKADKITVGSSEDGFYESECENSLPFAGPAVAFNENGNNGSDEARGTFSLGANGKAELKSSGHLEYAVKVEWRGEFPATTCTWEVAKLKGSESAFPGYLSVTFAKQKLKLAAGNSRGCPKTADYTVDLTNWWVHTPESEARIAGELGS